MIRFLFFLLLLKSTFLFATDLPSEHEIARLMLAVESSTEDKSWGKAQSQLQSLLSLKASLPDEFYYFNGLVLARQNHPGEALESLEKYVVNAGQPGKFYVSALKLITGLDEHLALSSKTNKTEVEKTSTIVGAKSDGYIKALQALYLTDDPIKALVMQINSLLSSHSYTGSRVKKAHSRTGTIYALSVTEQNLVIQEKNYSQGQPSLTMSKLNVLGVDPYLRHDCSVSEVACWIYHPANDHTRWLIIDRDEMVVNELSDALSKLILKLQQI